MTAPAPTAESGTQSGTDTAPTTPPAVPTAPAPATTESTTPPAPGTGAGTDDATFAEIAALAQELGITPGQLKGRLDASRKWEQRAKSNEAKANAEAERANAILKAAGIETAETDPIKALEESQQSNASLATENRALKVQLALVDAAKTHKADRSLLAAVLVHSGTLAQLDPASDTFAADLDKAVADAVKANPKLQDTAQFPDLGQGNRSTTPAGAQEDPNAWIRQAAGR